MLRCVYSKLDEPLMNRSAKALAKATREVTWGELTGGCKVRNSDLAFKMRTQHLLGANLLPDLEARLCPESSPTVSIVLQKMCAHKKRGIFQCKHVERFTVAHLTEDGLGQLSNDEVPFKEDHPKRINWCNPVVCCNSVQQIARDIIV